MKAAICPSSMAFSLIKFASLMILSTEANALSWFKNTVADAATSVSAIAVRKARFIYFTSKFIWSTVVEVYLPLVAFTVIVQVPVVSPSSFTSQSQLVLPFASVCLAGSERIVDPWLKVIVHFAPGEV